MSPLPQNAAEPIIGARARYLIDPRPSTARFRVKKFGFYPVRGGFGDAIRGDLTVVDGHLRGAGSVELAALRTGLRKRDEHVLSTDFFDATQYPTIEIVAEDIDVSESPVPAQLRLVIKSTTRVVPATVSVTDDSESRLLVHINGEIDRHDFGITPPAFMDKVVVGRTVGFTITLIGSSIAS
jgi:polyisoprenoid-binding protein YceI